MAIAIFNAVLASLVIIPILLWLFGCRLKDFYQLPNGRIHPVFKFFGVLFSLTAFAETALRVWLFSDAENFWMWLVLLAFAWFRALSMLSRQSWNVFTFSVRRLLIALTALAIAFSIVKALAPLREISLSTLFAVVLVLGLISVQLLIACGSVQIPLATSLFLFGLLTATTLVIGVGGPNNWFVQPAKVTWIAWLWPTVFWLLALMVFLRTPHSAQEHAAVVPQ